MKIVPKLPLMLLAFLLVVGCGQREPSSTSSVEPADLLFLNGKVYTVNPEQVWDCFH